MDKWFWQIAFIVFLLTCFLLISRLLDWAPGGFKLSAVLLGLLALTLLLSRRCFVFWRTTAGKILLVFAAWLMLAFFVSQRGPQSSFYLQTFFEGVLLFAAAAGLIATLADVGKLFNVLALAGLTAALLGIFWGTRLHGRLALPDGPYSDPNYYAMWLLAAVPLIWVSIARGPLWTKLLAGAAGALPLFVLLRTGSRAGIVSLGAVVLVLFILSPLRLRILLATALAVAAAAVIALAPSLLIRLLPSAQRSIDSDSSQARQTLLATSLAVTLNHPLFGVGPGNFPFFVTEEGRSRGFEWEPMNTHNSYTQISSETGVPGLLLLLALVGFSLRNVISLYRQSAPQGSTPDPQLHRLARAFLLSLAGLLTFMFFLSEGYNLTVFLWLGMAAGLRQLLPEPERAEIVEAVLPAAP